MSRFYNPGFKFEELKQYDNPLNVDGFANNISYLPIKAPGKDFFEVPDIGTVTDAGGEDIQVPLKLRPIILRYYAERGVICVDPNRKNVGAEEPYANSDEEAKIKGKAVWEQFMRETASEWFRIVQNAKASDWPPRPASGLFKRVLEELGMQDPANIVDNLQEAKQGQVDNKDMQAKLDAMAAQNDALKSQMIEFMTNMAAQHPPAKTGK